MIILYFYGRLQLQFLLTLLRKLTVCTVKMKLMCLFLTYRLISV